MNIKSTFGITSQFEPPYDTVEGVAFSRASFNKTFAGPLAATSTVQMLAGRTAVPGSAAYVALERIVGTLEGREGSFALVHMGLMSADQRSLTIHIVPDSGTGGLRGIAGTMDIQIVDGQHHYELNYTLDV